MDDDNRDAKFRALSRCAQDSNVNPTSLLATDYLNHVNEIVMLLALVPDAPECLEDCKAWQPKSYQDHFRQSGIADRDLAIEAYDYAPTAFRQPFDGLVADMNRLVAHSIERLATALEQGDAVMIQIVAETASHNLQDLIGQASAVIHGREHVIDQAQIDALMEF
jgi:hypothetical protein